MARKKNISSTAGKNTTQVAKQLPMIRTYDRAGLNRTKQSESHSSRSVHPSYPIQSAPNPSTSYHLIHVLKQLTHPVWMLSNSADAAEQGKTREIGTEEMFFFFAGDEDDDVLPSIMLDEGGGRFGCGRDTV